MLPWLREALDCLEVPTGGGGIVIAGGGWSGAILGGGMFGEKGRVKLAQRYGGGEPPIHSHNRDLFMGGATPHNMCVPPSEKLDYMGGDPPDNIFR